jgi:hypothetical protein
MPERWQNGRDLRRQHRDEDKVELDSSVEFCGDSDRGALSGVKDEICSRRAPRATTVTS